MHELGVLFLFPIQTKNTTTSSNGEVPCLLFWGAMPQCIELEQLSWH